MRRAPSERSHLATSVARGENSSLEIPGRTLAIGATLLEDRLSTQVCGVPTYGCWGL